MPSRMASRRNHDRLAGMVEGQHATNLDEIWVYHVPIWIAFVGAFRESKALEMRELWRW